MDKPKTKIPFSIFFIVSIAALFGFVFYTTLQSGGVKTENLDRDIPVFSMPALTDKGESNFFTSDDIIKNAPLLVNIWASWCAPCRAEHPFLEKLHSDYNIKIIGLNYKDTKPNAKRFIDKYGNPFYKIGFDESGMYSLDWGIRGVPETFVVNKQGKIVYKLQGELKEENFDDFLHVLKLNDFDIKKDIK